MIGRLLGHNRLETTARYAHLALDTEKSSAAKVGGSIGADILPEDDACGIAVPPVPGNGGLKHASWPS